MRLDFGAEESRPVSSARSIGRDVYSLFSFFSFFLSFFPRATLRIVFVFVELQVGHVSCASERRPAAMNAQSCKKCSRDPSRSGKSRCASPSSREGRRIFRVAVRYRLADNRFIPQRLVYLALFSFGARLGRRRCFYGRGLFLDRCIAARVLAEFSSSVRFQGEAKPPLHVRCETLTSRIALPLRALAISRLNSIRGRREYLQIAFYSALRS